MNIINAPEGYEAFAIAMDEEKEKGEPDRDEHEQAMDKHTPGPWFLLPGLRPRKTSNYDKTYRLAVLSPPLAPKMSSLNVAYAISEHAGVCLANARLISKAPTMLNILRCLSTVYLPQGNIQDDIRALLREIEEKENISDT